MRDEDVVELGLRERMRDVAVQRIDEFVFSKALFDMRTLAFVEQGVGRSASEEPVQECDMGRFENIEIATDYRRPRGIAFGHCAFEFFESLRWMSECKMDIEYAYGHSGYRHIGVQPAADAGL